MLHLVTPEQASLFRRIFENVCHPVFIFFLCTIFLAVYVCLKNPSWYARFLALFTACLLFLLATPWVPEYLINRLQDQYQSVEQTDSKVRWIVVLGGGVNEIENLSIGESLSASSMKRVLEGIRLRQMLPHATLLFSGGTIKGDTRYAVGQRMHEFALLILGSKIEDKVETDSINTADEVSKVKEMVGQEPFYLVTSALHMRRSMAFFVHAGMHPIAAPCDYIYFWKKEQLLPLYIPGAYNLAYFNKVWHEILGLLWGKIRGMS